MKHLFIIGLISLGFVACETDIEEAPIDETPETSVVIINEYGYTLNDYRVVRDTIRSGDTFGDILDENGVAINSENDDIVNLMHQTLMADTIIQLIEEDGILSNPRDSKSLIPVLSSSQIGDLITKNSGRFPPELIVVANPLRSSARLLLEVLFAVFFRALTKSEP